MLSAPRGTEMFQFPRYPPAAYAFSDGCPGITRDGLPHSDTLGSLPARGSPRRFAAWPRPSSAPRAEASTMCLTRGSPLCIRSMPTAPGGHQHDAKAIDPRRCSDLSTPLLRCPVELRGFEPLTSAVQGRRSPS